MRKYTNKLRKLIFNGQISTDDIVTEFLIYFKEEEIKQFMLKGFNCGLLTEDEIKELKE